MKIICIIFLAIVAVSCKKPYNPPAVTAPNSYLVVEGVINSGADSTFIKLSRTIKLSGTSYPPVSNAQITVESDNNSSYPLTETVPGIYTAVALNLDNTRKYRLRIQTPDNKQYLSDFVEAKNNPPIDSIGYIVTNKGLQLYNNTHNPNNDSKYYRWDYVETWQFHAKYFSEFYVVNHEIDLRPPNVQVYICFQTQVSSNIVLGSSADLTKDIIYQNPLTFIDATSEKVESRYSILVNQYTLTKDAYNFWTNLKKNTEQLGSIFDAQPSQINGNIHSVTNPAEPVIGYVSVTNTQSKRIFIDNHDLPNYFSPIYPYQCEQDSAFFYDPHTHNNEVEATILEAPPGLIDVTIPITVRGFVVGYLYSTPICADCTLRGSKIQPAFWKN